MRNLTELALFTDNVKTMVAFYERLLGTPPDVNAPDLAIFQLGTVRILIHYRYPDTADMPPNQDHFAVSVSNLDAACREFAAQGMELLSEPRQYEWGRSAYLRDPEGRLIEIAEQRD